MAREAIEFIKRNQKGFLTGVEVGVAQGTHAKEILNVLPMRQLYLIDDWSETPEFERRAKKLEAYGAVLIIKKDSVSAANLFPDGIMDFVYIDGGHSYKQVKADILAWKPKVREGGVLAGHDYGNHPACEGVKKAVDELIPNVVSTVKCKYPDWYVIV